jgi:hypothetical protein
VANLSTGNCNAAHFSSVSGELNEGAPRLAFFGKWAAGVLTLGSVFAAVVFKSRLPVRIESSLVSNQHLRREYNPVSFISCVSSAR